MQIKWVWGHLRTKKKIFVKPASFTSKRGSDMTRRGRQGHGCDAFWLFGMHRRHFVLFVHVTSDKFSSLHFKSVLHAIPSMQLCWFIISTVRFKKCACLQMLKIYFTFLNFRIIHSLPYFKIP